MPGGGGIRLKYSNPMYVDDVAVDFPEHADRARPPVVPVAGRGAVDRLAQAAGVDRPVGLVAEVLPAAARAVRATPCSSDKVLFGSDYPMITPDRWLADFEKLDFDEVTPR